MIKMYQLLTETRVNGATQLYKYGWSYDDAGNREWQKKWTTVDTWDHYREYTYNDANQLIDEDQWDTVSKGTWETHTDCTYDDAGNMTAKDVDDKIGAGDEDWDYTYNYENRQTLVEKDTGGGSAEVGQYIYNVVGNRVSREVNQTTTYESYYDGADCVGDYDGSNTRWFVTPGLDENLMLNNGSDYFYTQDGLGSVRELVDTNQDAQNIYDYEAFGSAYNWSTSLDDRYTYTGREWDSESGTYHYRMRQLYPTVGHFSSRDPVEGLNLYTYVNNNPLFYTDPFGAWKFDTAKYLAIAEKKDEVTDIPLSSSEHSLRKLAELITTDPEDAVCIWPIDEMKKVKSLKTVCEGEKFDYSNLFEPMSILKTLWFRTDNEVTSGVWVGGKVYNTPVEIITLLKEYSGEGATPIDNLVMLGHGNADDPLRIWSKTPYSGQKPQYTRAINKKGPVRCWFTRKPTYAGIFTCSGKIVAENFARQYLRKSAYVYAPGYDWSVVMKWHLQSFHFEQPGTGNTSKSYDSFYDAIDQEAGKALKKVQGGL